MIIFFRNNLKKLLKVIVVSGLLVSLSGCILAIPPALQMASMVFDGISYATTGKSISDHALSKLTSKDCAMVNVLKGTDICQAEEIEIATTEDRPNALAEDVHFEFEALNQGLPDSLDMETASGPTQ